MIVDISELIPNNYNPNKLSDIKFKALVNWIKEEGWNRLAPIEVLPKWKDWKYIIIDWFHRMKALKEAWINEAHIEISDLKDWYEKLRTLSKNLIHWQHDVIKEAELIKDIQEQWISDTEILKAIGYIEEQLIEINELNNIEIPEKIWEFIKEENFQEYKPQEEDKKIVLKLNETQYELLAWLDWYTNIKGIQDSILLTAQYFRFMIEQNEINEIAFENAKEIVQDTKYREEY